MYCVNPYCGIELQFGCIFTELARRRIQLSISKCLCVCLSVCGMSTPNAMFNRGRGYQMPIYHQFYDHNKCKYLLIKFYFWGNSSILQLFTVIVTLSVAALHCTAQY